MTPQPVTVALMGMPEAERRVLVSAVTSVQRSGMLPGALAWAAPPEADILILELDDASSVQQADAYDHLWPRERVAYGPRGLAGVAVSRPLKVQTLVDALASAMTRIATRLETNESAAPTVSPQPLPTAASPEPSSTPRPQRVYRGQAY